MLMCAVLSLFLWMDITTELCVTFVSMVNCCEVLSVCMKLFWEGVWVGAWGRDGGVGWDYICGD